MKRVSIYFLVIGLTGVLIAGLVSPAKAGPPGQFTDPVEQGKYLTTIAGCIGCHTPFTPEGIPDETRQFAGGQEFDLGPLGKLYSRNLTSDKETGLGDWTDEEIKLAIRAGVTRDGRHLFPLMPYVIFSNMAEADLDAIVAFLRTLPPVSNKFEPVQILPPAALPQLPIRTDIVAPDPANTAERGRYLLTAVIACTDCHTPVDPQTGAPVFDKYLAGGQPFEGPWGIVYGGNITPDENTGIGKWSDEDIKRILQQGVRPDGRQVVLMPWQEYTVLTEADLNAVVHYLRNDVKAVNIQVPAAALNEGFIEFVELPKPAGPDATQIALIAVGVIVVIAGVGAMVYFSRRARSGVK